MRPRRGSGGGSQFLDEQPDCLTLRVRAPWPLYRRVWTALEWKLTEHWGGWSDRSIEVWHSIIGAFNYHRGRYPRSQVHLHFDDAGGSAFNIDSATLAPGDLTVRTQVALVEAPVALAARLDFKIPIGSLSAAGGSGGVGEGGRGGATLAVRSWGV